VTSPDIRLHRIVPGTREHVFAAWTDPRLLSQWFFSGGSRVVDVTNDLRAGGGYRIEVIGEDATTHVQFGEYRVITPHSRLVFTWNCPSLGAENSLVTVDLVDRGRETELTLTHQFLDDPELRRLHELGWDGCLANLSALLAAT
jgi:uncharacterized protein YndB with AHSA1/START domain